MRKVLAFAVAALVVGLSVGFIGNPSADAG